MNTVFGRKVLSKKIMFRLRNWMTTSYISPLSTECETLDRPRGLTDIVNVTERMTLEVEESFSKAKQISLCLPMTLKNEIDKVQDDKRTLHHSCSHVI